VNDWPFRDYQPKVNCQAHIVPTDVSAEMRAGRQSEDRDFAKDVRLEHLVVASELMVGKMGGERLLSVTGIHVFLFYFRFSALLVSARFDMRCPQGHSPPPALS
jgi:hypothetical protein